MLTGYVLLRLCVVWPLAALLAGYVLREVTGVLLVVVVEASCTLVLHWNAVTAA